MGHVKKRSSLTPKHEGVRALCCFVLYSLEWSNTIILMLS